MLNIVLKLYAIRPLTYDTKLIIIMSKHTIKDEPSKVSPRPRAMNREYGSFSSLSVFSISVVVSSGVTLPSQQPTATKPQASAAVLTTYTHSWQFGIVVTPFVASTKLLYIKPG